MTKRRYFLTVLGVIVVAFILSKVFPLNLDQFSTEVDAVAETQMFTDPKDIEKSFASAEWQVASDSPVRFGEQTYDFLMADANSHAYILSGENVDPNSATQWRKARDFAQQHKMSFTVSNGVITLGGNQLYLYVDQKLRASQTSIQLSDFKQVKGAEYQFTVKDLKTQTTSTLKLMNMRTLNQAAIAKY